MQVALVALLVRLSSINIVLLLKTLSMPSDKSVQFTNVVKCCSSNIEFQKFLPPNDISNREVKLI